MPPPVDLFKSTAPFYVLYRPAYPAELFAHIIERFGLGGSELLLDLGCGPGTLTIPLAPHVARAIGIDPEPEMLAQARLEAEAAGVTNIIWIEARSEDLLTLREQLAPLDLVIIGSSFHWMDRETTLRDLDQLVAPHGGIVITGGYHSVIETRGDWQEASQAVIKRWLGAERRAGSGTYPHPTEHHDALLARSTFAHIEQYQLEGQLSWTVERIIGNLLSTSYCSPAVLGDLREPFERDLRAALLALNPQGIFTEDVVLEATLAWRT